MSRIALLVLAVCLFAVGGAWSLARYAQAEQGPKIDAPEASRKFERDEPFKEDKPIIETSKPAPPGLVRFTVTSTDGDAIQVTAGSVEFTVPNLRLKPNGTNPGGYLSVKDHRLVLTNGNSRISMPELSIEPAASPDPPATMNRTYTTPPSKSSRVSLLSH